MSKLKQAIRENKQVEKEQFRLAQQQSADYARALGLSNIDVATMEGQNIVVRVQLPGVVPVKIFAKHIRVNPFKDVRSSFSPDTEDWQDLLQARLEGVARYSTGQYSTGGGTTYFTTVPRDIHEKLLDALANEEYELREARIWP